MLKALLFDLDGTLANTDAVHFPTWMEVLRPHGIEVTREYYDNRLAGRVNKDVVDDVLPDLSDEERRKLIDAEEKRSRERASEIGPLPGLRDLLDEGRRRELSLALVTNSVEADADQILEPLDLEGVFDPIVYPSEVSESKPEPTPYLELLDRLGIEADEALAFEDSVTGAEASRAAGIQTVGISSAHTPEELKEAGVDLVIGDFADQALYDLMDGLSS
ncbi:MAG: HAD family phosphatase [Rubrobacteraceae bacterium]